MTPALFLFSEPAVLFRKIFPWGEENLRKMGGIHMLADVLNQIDSIVGIEAIDVPIVVPRVDDCVGIY